MTIQDADFLMGGGGHAAKFETIGDEIEGTIVSAVKQQATDPGTGKPKTFDNGDPVFQYVITLQTALCDPEDPNDEGLRRLYAKGGSAATEKGTTLLVAIREAIRSAGASTIETGATLKVRFTDTRKSNFPQPSKLFKAKYTSPAPSAVSEDDLF